MKNLQGRIRLSPTDLANYAACPHLTTLDLAAARGELAPASGFSHATEALRRRGKQHEAAYVEHLRAQGLTICDLRGHKLDAPGSAGTLAAMRDRTDVILQAPLMQEGWGGFADVLRRVDAQSALGDWSYEPLDTKLARETRGSAILQLCAYAAVLHDLQGLAPERIHVVSPGDPFTTHTFRRADYDAYYRLLRKQVEARVAEGEQPVTYPDPVSHCDICRWGAQCEQYRRGDDHLSLVANIRSSQIEQLQRWDVKTLAALGEAPVPFAQKPDRGTLESLHRSREQARVQLAGRSTGRWIHELLPLETGEGLHRLPEPSLGDIFFDLEGDPFVPKNGREYLFGYVYLNEDGGRTYTADWALSAEAEKMAFEQFIDFVMVRWEAHPGLHICHYAPYEPSAIKRLMGRYGTRGDEVDRMLRAELFVDLYAVVRQSVRASVESYSIKKLEPFYGFTRQMALPDAGQHLRALEMMLEFGETSDLDAETMKGVAQYNEDDCVSTLELRSWLEGLRGQCLEDGHAIPRPGAPESEASEKLTARQAEVRALMDRLLADVPVAVEERSAEEQGRWILANLLEFHRREDKAAWWEYYRLADLPAADYEDEPSAIFGLTFVEPVGGTEKAPIHRYSFPPQELKPAKADVYYGRDLKLGASVACDLDARTIDIKKTGKTAELHPERVFFFDRIPTRPLPDSLFDLGNWVVAEGLTAHGPYRAIRDLLVGAGPRLSDGAQWQLDGESAVDRAVRLASSLDQSVLAIQGPPGAGKTFAGARIICALVKAGRKVGITAPSHKVIRNLLDETLKHAKAQGLALPAIQKVSDDAGENEGPITETRKNSAVLEALQSGDASLAAGTAWLWAGKDFESVVDVLVLDEAGQMSLANVIAAGRGARNLVLLGDPQQLDQPLKGTHPDGTAVSVLEHVLAGAHTIPDGRGLFLPETWRLSPTLAAFTSGVFYEGRLRSREGLEAQVLNGPLFAGSRLHYLPVQHQGNQSHSPEEVNAVASLAAELMALHTWTNAAGVTAPITWDDILIVAPYNFQVSALRDRLPNARIGTIDRFQGQQAAIVIYSATTSSPEDAPRGMEFLYSLNRLNVATSRARCAVFLVANPRLFEPNCQTPRQMQLANALCRYLELAQRVGAEAV